MTHEKQPYWTYDTNTMIINTNVKMAEFRGGMYHKPRNSIIDEPPEDKDGFVIVLGSDLLSMDYVEDNRGTEVTSTDGDYTVSVISELGPIPEGTTITPRPSEFHNWVDGEWTVDTFAEYEAQYQEVRDTRESLFDSTTDNLDSKANVARKRGLDEKADEYDALLLVEYDRIVSENPYPDIPDGYTGTIGVDE